MHGTTETGFCRGVWLRVSWTFLAIRMFEHGDHHGRGFCPASIFLQDSASGSYLCCDDPRCASAEELRNGSGSECLTDGGGVAAASGSGRSTWTATWAKANVVFLYRYVFDQLERMSLSPCDVDGGRRSSYAGASESGSDLDGMNSSSRHGHHGLSCVHDHCALAGECRRGRPDVYAHFHASDALPRRLSLYRPAVYKLANRLGSRIHMPTFSCFSSCFFASTIALGMPWLLVCASSSRPQSSLQNAGASLSRKPWS